MWRKLGVEAVYSKFMINYYFWWVVGGLVRKKTKLMLYSTLVEIEIEVGVELGKSDLK